MAHIFPKYCLCHDSVGILIGTPDAVLTVLENLNLWFASHPSYEPRENQSSGFSTKSDTNRPVQSLKRARSLKFRI